MKSIGFCIPCYNEEKNIENIYTRITDVMTSFDYAYSILFIDNSSSDRSPEILMKLAAQDNRVKVILNNKNFGPGKSGAYGFFNTSGDAVITMACDLQDPPELIPSFLEKWEQGEKLVLGKKTDSQEKQGMFFIRSLYYKIMNFFLPKDEAIDQITGFGLYDREVVDNMKRVFDPNPNFRYLLGEMGYKPCYIEFVQPQRLHGVSSYNFFSYLDTAIVTLVTNSKKPVRLLVYVSTVLCALNALGAIAFLVAGFFSYSLWLGLGFFVLAFLISCTLFAVSFIGEYVVEILEREKGRPLVYEKCRLNFEESIDEKSETIKKS